MCSNKITLVVLFFMLFSWAFQAQEKQVDIWFHPNKGQWNERILYKVELGQGELLIERDGFTYALNNLGEVYGHAHGHDHDDDHGHEEDLKVNYHAVFTKFLNSSWSGHVEEKDSSLFYRNYFIGNDPSKWASKLHGVQYLKMTDYYPGIDLILEVVEGAIKYTFDIAPGVDPSIITVLHKGSDGVIYTKDGVGIQTRFGVIHEGKLAVWTEDGSGKKEKVACDYAIESDTVRFVFPNGYDDSQRLILDPEITFSTFTGSTADNWGFTATPDEEGNTFGGGIVFGPGYPITPGAYDGDFNGGYAGSAIDIGISKFNAQGNQLMYSTYLGGHRNETPNSIVANSAGELYVMSVTSSNDIPMAGNSINPNFSGGNPIPLWNGIQFDGTDLVFFKLSPDGTNLLASTYFGGTGNEGLNTGALEYNFGDRFRGEITLDANELVYFSSTTRSTDFPANNGFNTTLGGEQDAVAGKLSPNLDQVYWSTYIGGPGLESGNALQISSSGNVYVSGGTTSSVFNLGSNGHNTTYQGGHSDGYVIQLNGQTSNPISGTFIGTSGYDQAFFVQLDPNDDVYVFGQSDGGIEITPGKYNVPNSGQFIRKYNEQLTDLLWSTQVGGGNNRIEISPTAFLVSDCYEIYYAGWGGVTSGGMPAQGSTTNNFPVTPNAFQPTTNGNNFYIAVLSDDADELAYATFMGGTNSSPNHVDGGTSRFDKKGRIYHAVCASCGATNSGFTSTPGAYSTTANSSNCNMAVFKFDLGFIESTVATPAPFVCIPDEVTFTNLSQNANAYHWDFGDGNTSTEFEPIHYYQTPGTYTVTLTALDTLGCYDAQVTTVEVTIGLYEGAIADPSAPICPGESFQLEASGGTTYLWSPAEFLDDPTSPTPIATITENTEFTVIISDTCGTDTLTTVLELYDLSYTISDNASICKGQTIDLEVSGGVSFQWSPIESILGDANGSQISVAPEETTVYSVEITTEGGCEMFAEVTVTVADVLPTPIIQDTARKCMNDSVSVSVSGGDSYLWSPPIQIDTTAGSSVSIYSLEDRYYYVEFFNACGSILDSVYIKNIFVEATSSNDTIVCPGNPVDIWVEGGEFYYWTPEEYAHPNTAPAITVNPPTSTLFEALVTDSIGCWDVEQVMVAHYPKPSVTTNPDYYGILGDEVVLEANGSSVHGNYTWYPQEYLNCVNCPFTSAKPPFGMTYTVEFVDQNGCVASDDVTIYFDPLVYVPNAFTPNGDGGNDFFKPVLNNVGDEFELLIFNRWGEVIFETNDRFDYWDGTYQGKDAKDGTYIWRIIYADLEGNKAELMGHVTILR